jgi:hypothetical protein
MVSMVLVLATVMYVSIVRVDDVGTVEVTVRVVDVPDMTVVSTVTSTVVVVDRVVRTGTVVVLVVEVGRELVTVRVTGSAVIVVVLAVIPQQEQALEYWDVLAQSEAYAGT